MVTSQQMLYKLDEHQNLTLQPGFFKENVRYPLWTYRDLIYLILETK